MEVPVTNGITNNTHKCTQTIHKKVFLGIHVADIFTMSHDRRSRNKASFSTAINSMHVLLSVLVCVAPSTCLGIFDKCVAND